MSAEFYPGALEIARLRRNMTVADVSSQSGISTRELRRIANGEAVPSGDTVEAISKALRYPAEFFRNSALELPASATFRAMKSMTKREAGAGLAAAALGGQLSLWLEREFDVPEAAIPDLAGWRPEDAANALRAGWGLGERPIGNLVRLLEAKGVRVFSLSEETLRLDAFATWIGTRPFVLLNGVKSAEHSRFDAAHELGHLCLHRDGQQGKEVEDEANRFAASFLMPAGDVVARRVFPALSNLIKAKARWGVSLSALVRRYCDLGLMKEDRAKWAYIEMSRKGYLKNEPEPIERERSAIWTQVLQAMWRERRSITDLSAELDLPVDEVQRLIFVNREELKSEPPLQRTAERVSFRVVKTSNG